MLRRSCRLADHIGMSATSGRPVYKNSAEDTFMRRRLRSFTRRGPLGRVMTVVGYGAAGIAAYIAACLVVRTAHQRTVDSLFAPGLDYTLEEWVDVEPTLEPGDVLLMRGTGPMSWCITTLQFILSGMSPAALRYSHVAVVVAPAIIEYVDADSVSDTDAAAARQTVSGLSTPPYRVPSLRDVFATDVAPSKTGKAGATVVAPTAASDRASASSVRAQLQAEETALRRRPVVRRGAIILEAMDNKEYDVPDVKGNVTHDTVQLVEASRRLHSMTPGDVPAYHYFAVRRLRNYEHTPERQARLARFCEASEGRCMDSSLLYPLAFMSPKMHANTHPLRQLVTGEVSCSELILELYQELGIVQRRWRWVPVPSDASGSATRTDNLAAAAAAAAGASATSPTPQPTAADVADDRRGCSLHVYDFVYGRLDAQARQPLLTRDRPLLPDEVVVENGAIIAAPAVRLRSTTPRLRPTWPHVDRLKEMTDIYGRVLSGSDAERARQHLQRRTESTYKVDPAVPAVTLRAGDVARGVDGQTYQLQWYYAHNSLATCPFHFTEGMGEQVIDFAANIGLSQESFIRIVRGGSDALLLAMKMD